MNEISANIAARRTEALANAERGRDAWTFTGTAVQRARAVMAVIAQHDDTYSLNDAVAIAGELEAYAVSAGAWPARRTMIAAARHIGFADAGYTVRSGRDAEMIAVPPVCSGEGTPVARHGDLCESCQQAAVASDLYFQIHMGMGDAAEHIAKLRAMGAYQEYCEACNTVEVDAKGDVCEDCTTAVAAREAEENADTLSLPLGPVRPVRPTAEDSAARSALVGAWIGDSIDAFKAANAAQDAIAAARAAGFDLGDPVTWPSDDVAGFTWTLADKETGEFHMIAPNGIDCTAAWQEAQRESREAADAAQRAQDDIDAAAELAEQRAREDAADAQREADAMRAFDDAQDSAPVAAGYTVTVRPDGGRRYTLPAGTSDDDAYDAAVAAGFVAEDTDAAPVTLAKTSDTGTRIAAYTNRQGNRVEIVRHGRHAYHVTVTVSEPAGHPERTERRLSAQARMAAGRELTRPVRVSSGGSSSPEHLAITNVYVEGGEADAQD